MVDALKNTLENMSVGSLKKTARAPHTTVIDRIALSNKCITEVIPAIRKLGSIPPSPRTSRHLLKSPKSNMYSPTTASNVHSTRHARAYSSPNADEIHHAFSSSSSSSPSYHSSDAKHNDIGMRSQRRRGSVDAGADSYELDDDPITRTLSDQVREILLANAQLRLKMNYLVDRIMQDVSVVDVIK